MWGDLGGGDVDRLNFSRFSRFKTLFSRFSRFKAPFSRLLIPLRLQPLLVLLIVALVARGLARGGSDTLGELDPFNRSDEGITTQPGGNQLTN
ncbi:hypothetical protein CS379_07000, partial [Methylobacterium frigidaeris]